MADRAATGRLREIARRAMIQRGLLPDFTAEAQRQADQSKQRQSANDSVRDLRDRLWCSIDNDDSRDLDQLSVAEPLADGSVRILVAIADVDAAVARDTPVDEHARANTTSVYTVAQIFPMLPEKLSTDETSLADGAERLAIVVDMTVDTGGTVLQSALYRARVRNRAKLAYRGVSAWLEGTGPAPAPLAAVPGLDEQLRIQDRIARCLKHTRSERGALSLQSIEAQPVFDDGLLVDLRADPKNRAQELIEELMVAANGASARFLEEKGFPSIRRVLHAPERWDRIVALARESGEILPAAPDARALNAFLTSRRDADPEHFPDLSLSVIKMLGPGEYDVDTAGRSTDGHFALASRDYTHSTAPNRRFPDLVTQRLIKAALADASPPYSADELRTLAAHCTAQENQAERVERQVRKSAAALLLEGRTGARFEGLVTGASDKGTWVRILRPPLEGRIVRGFQGLDVGDRVTVRLVHTDVERGFIDFEGPRAD